VLVRGRRSGHVGLLLGSCHGGEWEEIGILADREFRDTRPLPPDDGQPETRDNRARFWDGSEKISGEWTALWRVTGWRVRIRFCYSSPAFAEFSPN
jgi:hypothetical protein